jgi:hypothetical protein
VGSRHTGRHRCAVRAPRVGRAAASLGFASNPTLSVRPPTWSESVPWVSGLDGRPRRSAGSGESRPPPSSKPHSAPVRVGGVESSRDNGTPKRRAFQTASCRPVTPILPQLFNPRRKKTEESAVRRPSGTEGRPRRTAGSGESRSPPSSQPHNAAVSWWRRRVEPRQRDSEA